MIKRNVWEREGGELSDREKAERREFVREAQGKYFSFAFLMTELIFLVKNLTRWIGGKQINF